MWISVCVLSCFLSMARVVTSLLREGTEQLGEARGSYVELTGSLLSTNFTDKAPSFAALYWLYAWEVSGWTCLSECWSECTLYARYLSLPFFDISQLTCTIFIFYGMSKFLRGLRWAGNVARMGASRDAYRVLMARPEGRRPLGRPMCRWEDNIKMNFREVGWGHRLDRSGSG